MKLTLIGTGDFRSTAPLASAGYVVQSGATTLKLDFGQGNLLNMARAGIDWRALNAILISHIHPDHISDLFQYLQAVTVSHAFGELENDAIQLYGPKGFRDYFEQLRRVVITTWDTLPTVQDVYDEQWIIGDIRITTLPMKHAVHCAGFRLEAEGKRLCYTGDTGLNDNLYQLAQDADILLAECSEDDNESGEGHLRPKDIMDVARAARVKKVVLTHYPTSPTIREDRRSRIEQQAGIPVVAGNDLDRIEC